MAILFDCPECGAPIRVGDEAAGRRGACPSCKAKIIVPEPETEPADASDADEESAPEDDGFPAFAAAESEPAIASPVHRKTQKSRGLSSLLAPVLCLAVLGAVGGWFYYVNMPRLEGDLEGTPLTDPEPLGGIVPNGQIDLPVADRKEILADLTQNPAELKSSLAKVMFKGSPEGLLIELEPGEEARLVRVDPKQDARLAKYTKQHVEQFDRERRQALGAAVREFLLDWDHFRNTKGAKAPNLATYRNSVGLTAMAGPFGWHVEAVWGSERFACFYEDSKGRLYFLLPKKVKSFVIRGRTVPGEYFPGDFKVALGKPESGAGASRIPIESIPKPGGARSNEEAPGMSERAGMDSMDSKDDDKDDSEK
jgi:DNA-directed RNA polymerase subunit RPC12/RpoP